METDFFEKVEQAEEMTSGGPVLLPVLIRQATLAACFFSLPAGEVREILPAPDLVPLEKWRGRALLGFGVVSCRDTTSGPLDLFALVLPVKFRPASGTRLVPALRMASTLSFELFAWEIVCSSESAVSPGQEIWGYPVKAGEVSLEEGPGRVTGRLGWDGRQALSFTLLRKRPTLKTFLEFNTYSAREGQLLWTPVRGLSLRVARSFLPGAARLDLGDHPLAERLRAMDLSNRSSLSLYASDLQALVPAPERSYPQEVT